MDYTGLEVLIVLFALVWLVILAKSIHTIAPYETGVVLIFGAFRRTLPAGFQVTNPLARVVRVDMRSRSAALPAFPAPTRSGVPVLIGVRSGYHVVDAAKSVFQTGDLSGALQECLKQAVSAEFARVVPESIPTGGWVLAEAVRARAIEMVAKYGAALEVLTLVIQLSSGTVEYASGTPTGSTQTVPAGPRLR